MSHQTTSSAVVRDEGRRGNKESRTRPLAGQTGRPPQCHPHDCAERSSSPETVATCCGTYTEQPSTGRPRSLSLIHISEPTRLGMISYAVFSTSLFVGSVRCV